MKNELPDEKFDQLMQRLMNDASLDESVIDDIADSPSTWWGVQRRINEEKTAKSPWPPANGWKRWLLVAVPTFAVILFVALVLINRMPTQENLVANGTVRPATDTQPTMSADGNEHSDSTLPVLSHEEQRAPLPVAAKRSEKPRTFRAAASIGSTKIKPTTAAANTHRTEIKTDFIALTYARDPDSGQLVRVRVPSSMMVTLGLVASVKKPTEMVDAEVLVGDDGLTRAIRFIR